MYTAEEFRNLPKESLFGPACAIVIVLLSFLTYQGASLWPFLSFSDPAPYTFLITLFGFMLKVSQDTRDRVESLFWAHSMVLTAMNAFGGGFLAPLIVGHCPTPLLEESFFWVLVCSWYVTHHIPFFSAYWARLTKERPVQIVLCVLFSIFKTQQIFGAVEIASGAVPTEPLGPKARYFTVPWAAMLVCGFLGGCGGVFLPFDKGLSPIMEGKRWPVSAAFISSVALVYSTRLFGVDKLTAKIGICIFRIIGEVFPGIREQVLNVVTPYAVAVTGVKHFVLDNNKKPATVVPLQPSP